MRIAHIATGYPIGYPGGITNYVRSLAAEQTAQGHSVTVYCKPADVEATFPFQVAGFSSDKLRPFSLRVVDRDPAAAGLLDSLRGNFDVVHFHMGLDLALEFYGGLATTGIPYIVSVHDYFLICPRITMVNYRDEVEREVDLERCSRCVGYLDQIDALEKLHRVTGFVLPRVRSRAVYRRADVMRQFLASAKYVLPVSTRVRELMEAVAPDVRYRVCHIGTQSSLAERHPKIASETMRCTVLGTLSTHKGAKIIERLLEGIQRPDLEFAFFGRSDSKTLQRLEARGLVNHGSYKPDDLPRIMSQTDLGVVTPIWEDNAPQVVMEFLNHGVPVLGTRMGGIPDFVNASNGILFDPHDDASIRDVITLLNRITKNDVERLANGTRRLTTPAEHVSEIMEIYGSALYELT